VTSGYMSGFCAAHRERLDAVARNTRRQAIIANFPGRELKDLEKTAAEYFDTRSRDEIDMSGTARGMFGIQEKARLEDELVTALEQVRDASFLPADSDDPRGLDHDIATLMARLPRCSAIAQMERSLPGAISRSGILRTQAAWLRYRTAFIALAIKVRPETKRGAWKRRLNEERLRKLRELAVGC
jgi:hypothetical protein